MIIFDDKGNPLYAYDGAIQPQINISETGNFPEFLCDKFATVS